MAACTSVKVPSTPVPFVSDLAEGEAIAAVQKELSYRILTQYSIYD